MNIPDFLLMGGHGAYLWPAFGLTLFVLIFNIWNARRALAEARSAATRLLQMEDTRS